MRTIPPLGITARAIVDRVIDGDTVVVSLTLPVTVRIKDLWSPEVTGPEREQGLDAKAYMEDLLEEEDRVILQIESEDARSLADVFTFGRVIGTIWRAKDERSVADLMSEAGHGTREKQRG